MILNTHVKACRPNSYLTPCDPRACKEYYLFTTHLLHYRRAAHFSACARRLSHFVICAKTRTFNSKESALNSCNQWEQWCCTWEAVALKPLFRKVIFMSINLVEESSLKLNIIVFILVLVPTPYLEINYWRKKTETLGKKTPAKTMKTGWIIIRVKAMPITKMLSYITAVIMIILMPQEKGCRRLLEQQKSLDCRSYVRRKAALLVH